MNVEDLFHDYVERFRVVLAPGTWQSLVMDLAKNDILALLYLHRTRDSRMSEIASFLEVPMNTATGVVARLQRRGLVERAGSAADKRIVVVALTSEGRRQVNRVVKEMVSLIGRLFDELTEEEIDVVLKVVDRVPQLLLERSEAAPRQRRRIPID